MKSTYNRFGHVIPENNSYVLKAFQHFDYSRNEKEVERTDTRLLSKKSRNNIGVFNKLQEDVAAACGFRSGVSNKKLEGQRGNNIHLRANPRSSN